MATWEADARSPGSATSELALLIDRKWTDRGPHAEATALRFLAVVREVAQEAMSIKLRVARVLAWCRRHDVRVAGFPNWAAFVKEHAPWCLSHTRAYLQLASSPLELIKEALKNHQIDVTTAFRATRELGSDASPEGQASWILAANHGEGPPRNRAYTDLVIGEQKRRVQQARRLGAILLGGDPPAQVVDAFLLDCHERRLTNEQILERAHEVPPAPDRLGEAAPDLLPCDPSDALFGPWVEPADLHHAIRQLLGLEGILAKRSVLLGMACDRIRCHALWTALPDCDSLEELCVSYFGIGLRSFERYAKEGLVHSWHPEVRNEVLAGSLTIDRANFALERGGTNELSLQSWLELVRRLGRAELKHASRERSEDLRTVYSPALTLAKAVEAQLRSPTDSRATPNSATAARVAAYLRRVGAKGPVQVAVRDGRLDEAPPPEPAHIYAPPKLLAAAEYVLRVVVLPPARGPRAMVAHDRYTCQNPRCRQRTLRVHPHHIQQRQHGGTDDPSNLVTLCPACHLGGIHSDRMSVVRIDGCLVWTWPETGIVLMHSPVSDLVLRLAPPKRNLTGLLTAAG